MTNIIFGIVGIILGIAVIYTAFRYYDKFQKHIFRNVPVGDFIMFIASAWICESIMCTIGILFKLPIIFPFGTTLFMAFILYFILPFLSAFLSVKALKKMRL